MWTPLVPYSRPSREPPYSCSNDRAVEHALGYILLVVMILEVVMHWLAKNSGVAQKQ
jgi:hypothetical protein